MITAKEARKNSESINIDEYITYLDRKITEASRMGRDHITITNQPYCHIGSGSAGPAMKRVQEQLTIAGFVIEHKPALHQLDNAVVKISW